MNRQLAVDRSSAVPVYRQLADWMVEKISTEEWHAGHQIPAEPTLAEELGVSRGTLRKTIGMLVQRRLLIQVQGKGTFVSSAMIDQPLAGRLTSVSAEFIRSGTPFATAVLRQMLMPAGEREADALKLRVGAPVLLLERVRAVDDEPVMLNESYLPAARFGELVDVDFRQERLFETLESRFGIMLVRASRSISAITANTRVAHALDVDSAAPVLYNEQTVFDSTDTPVEFSKAWFRGDRFRLTSEATRQEGESLQAVTLPNRWEMSGVTSP